MFLRGLNTDDHKICISEKMIFLPYLQEQEYLSWVEGTQGAAWVSTGSMGCFCLHIRPCSARWES